MGAIKIVRGKTREICEQIQRKEKFGRLFFTENEEAVAPSAEMGEVEGGAGVERTGVYHCTHEQLLTDGFPITRHIV